MSVIDSKAKVQKASGRSLLLIPSRLDSTFTRCWFEANTMPFSDEKLGAASHARHESLLASACALVDV
jgi:hypothetical protein